MCIRRFTAVLLCSTALAGPAQADPVTMFVSGFVNAVGASAYTAAVASAIGGATWAGFTVGSFLTGTFVGRVVLSVGLDLVASALLRQRMPSPSQRLVNFAQPSTPMERVYGRVKKGGPLGVTFKAGNRRHYTVIIAAHSTRGVVEHWLDARQAFVDGAGIITTSPMDGVGSIRCYSGKAGQVADAELVAESSGQITSAHDFAGLSYAALCAKAVGSQKFAKCYPSGREWAYLPVWDGDDTIRDPRIGDGTLRTNVVPWSQVLGHATYALTNAVVDSDVRAAPDATMTADLLRETVTAAGVKRHRFASNFLAGHQYTISIHAEVGPGARHLGIVLPASAFGGAIRAVYDLTTGAVGGTWLSPDDADIVPLGGGKYRVFITATATATASGNVDLHLSNSLASAFPGYAGDGTSGVYIWGYQVEDGAGASTYKPTTGDAVSAYWGRDWTANAALVIAQEILFHGRQVDWDNVAAQAEIADQIISNGDGGTQRRWTINGVFDDSMDWETVRAALTLACDAWFDESDDGLVRFRVGAFEEPDLILTERDFVALEITEGAWGPDEYGEFVVRYVEPERDWVETPCGAVVFAAGQPRMSETCGLISNHNQAFRVAWRMGKIARAPYALRGTLKLVGYEVIGRRFVRIQAFGFDIRAEVSKLSRDRGGMTFQIEARSVEAADFAPGAELEPARPVYVQIESDDAVELVTGLTATVVEGIGGQGVIQLEWPAQEENYTQQLRWRSAGAGVTEWQILAVPADQTTVVFGPPRDGETYEFQARNLSNSGRPSDWAPETPVAVDAVANTSPPPALAAFSAAVVSGDVAVSFTAPNSALYVSTRIFRADGSTDFADAIAVHQEFGAPNVVDSWTDAAPGTGDHAYWAEPLNASGVAGPRSGPASVTII